MSMEKKPAEAYGGSYYDFSLAGLPILGVVHLAAGGLALPSNSDSAEAAYVLQGAGTCGVVLPEAEAIPVKEGDMLALPLGVATWWHNAHGASTDLVVLFLGDTSRGDNPGILTGYSTDFVGRAWDEDAVLETLFNTTTDMVEKLLRSKRLDSVIFFAPPAN